MTMKCAADFADWYDQTARNFNDGVLTEFVDQNPSVLGVWVAGTAASTGDLVGMFVDLGRLGNGAAEGSASSVFQDALRVLNVIPVGRVAATVGAVTKPTFGRIVQGVTNTYYWRTLRGKACVPISIGQALQFTGQKLVIGLDDVAKAAGRELKSFDVHGMNATEVRVSLNALRAKFVEYPGGVAQGWGGVVRHAQNTEGVLLVSLKRTFSGRDTFHRIMVGNTPSGVKIFDRKGVFDSIDDLSRRYGSRTAAEAYSVNPGNPLIVIHNWVMDPALAARLDAVGPLGAVAIRAQMQLGFSPSIPAETIKQKFVAHVADMEKRNPGSTRKAAGAPVAGSAPAADFESPYPVRSAGLMLSKVSKDRYGTYELWPLIYDDNRALMPNGPNKVPHGPDVSLRIRKKSKYTPAELDRAKKNWQNWQSYR